MASSVFVRKYVFAAALRALIRSAISREATLRLVTFRPGALSAVKRPSARSVPPPRGHKRAAERSASA